MALFTFDHVKFLGHFTLLAAFLGRSLVDYCLFSGVPQIEQSVPDVVWPAQGTVEMLAYPVVEITFP